MNKLLLTAAMTGIMGAALATPASAMTANNDVLAEKHGCNGQNSCEGKHSCEGKDEKNSCDGKNSCNH